MVLLEALSLGLPVVSFDCPNGPRHIIKDNNDGVLVSYLNIEKLANNIIDFIQNKNKLDQFSNQAKINVSRFSESQIMPLWLNILEK